MRIATALLAVLLGLAGPLVLQRGTAQAASLDSQADIEQLAIDLTDKAMHAFVDGIRKGDFSGLRDIGSAHFKATYTVADINQAFRSFGATIVTGDPLADQTPVFLEEPAMKDGLLAIQGLYELPDGLLLFELAFAPEQGDWALDGIDVRSQPVEGPSTSAVQVP